MVGGEGCLTYGELARQTAAIVRRLRRAGIGSEAVVGLAAERSFEMVAGLLAILASGAAFLPLDPDLPPERLAFLIADGAPAALLVQARLEPAFAPLAPDLPRLALGEQETEPGDDAALPLVVAVNAA